MGTARPIGAKLFLEGIEVPFIGASFTSTVGQANIAYIDVVPHKAINNILPRTAVEIFVRDVNAESKSFPYVSAFSGEVFGFSFNKTPSSRSVSLSAIDTSSYWDNVLTYFFNAQQSLSKGGENVSELREVTVAGSAFAAKVSPTTHAVSSYFLQIMSKVLSGKPSGDFLDGLIAVIQDIGSVNHFYKLGANRLRINDRILLRSSGELANLLNGKEGLEWFTGIIGRNTGFQTLRGVIQDLMGILFHDFVSMPFPAVVSKTKMTAPLTAGKTDTIGQYLFKPNLFMMPPPICNVFFPDEYSSFSFARNFLQEPTRLIYQPELPVFNSTAVSLPHAYEPPAFASYMAKRKDGATFIGTADTQIPQNWGVFGDPTKEEFARSTKIQREQQFLSNEECMKGILIAKEGMVPAATQFNSSVSNTGKFSKDIAKYLFFKKRFQHRTLEITSHLKMSVVPGFPVLILDDSDAEQTVVAYCNSVTHRVYATQGGYTNTTLSYARLASEQDASSGKANEPLIPPWFSSAIFGKRAKAPASKDKKRSAKVSAAGEQLVYPDKISDFYKALLGDEGSASITSLSKEGTMLGASLYLAEEYRRQRALGPAFVHKFIDEITRRRYVTLEETFRFLGAKSAVKDFTLPFAEFTGGSLVGTNAKLDAPQIAARRKVINEYRTALKSSRGFRG
jgi:hypothetical protein